MATGLKLVEDVRTEEFSSVRVCAPFNRGLRALERGGYKLISLREMALIRMREGPEAYISRNGNWVREGVLYLSDGDVRLTKRNPILENAVEATKAHENGREFYVTGKQRDKALENSVSLRGGAIPTNRFGSDERTVFMFGSLAEDYGYWLRKQKITGMPIWLTDTRDRAFVNPAWFSNLGGRSSLNGYCRLLDTDIRMRGVRASSGAASERAEERIRIYQDIPQEDDLTRIYGPNAVKAGGLRTELEDAILLEYYEAAAKIRDKLKSLEVPKGEH